MHRYLDTLSRDICHPPDSSDLSRLPFPRTTLSYCNSTAQSIWHFPPFSSFSPFFFLFSSSRFPSLLLPHLETTPENLIASHSCKSMLVVVELRQLYKNSHATEELQSEPKRRKVAGDKIDKTYNIAQKLLLKDEPDKISELDMNQIHHKSTFDTEMDTIGPETDMEDTEMALAETITTETTECSCGYLHGAGQGFHHDKTATGLGTPLLRGPD